MPPARCLIELRPCAGSSLAMNASTSALAALKFFFSLISRPAHAELDSATHVCYAKRMTNSLRCTMEGHQHATGEA